MSQQLPGGILGVSILFSAPIMTGSAYAEEDVTCLDYYTVGESACRPAASTPLPAREESISRSTEKVQEKQEKSPVDAYLDSYGKPPREFVEFYLNPTAENANKWMQTYRQMMQQGKDMSQAWQQADQLYQTTGGVSLGLVRPPEPQSALIEPVSVTVPVQISENKVKNNDIAPSIGAFGQRAELPSTTLGGIRAPMLSLVYYFSQTCPYCARTTPDLAVIAEELKNKLTFTCVDVTPLGVDSKPNQSYITSKLPCQWRLPAEGEVERENVAQTPTLLIQKEGSAQVRLSGYVPLAQLRQYF